jgi:hypothetical protein
MSRHLIDIPVGWALLGDDLLEGAPPSVRSRLADGGDFPSRQLEDARTSGSAGIRMQVTERSLHFGAEWGYVLHDRGIEVIALAEQERGPIVAWTTHPHTRFSDFPVLWVRDRPVPAKPTSPPRTTTSPPEAKATPGAPARR